MNVSRILRFWLKYFKFFTMMEKSMKYLSTGKGFPGGAKNPPVNAGGVRDMGLIPGDLVLNKIKSYLYKL